MSAKEEIIEYLKEKYSPEAILLFGSRAVGDFTEESDWDLILLKEGGDDISGGFKDLNGNILDVTVKDWPEKDSALTTPHAPVWPLELLYSSFPERTDDLITANKLMYDQGPLNTKYSEACSKRLKKLSNWGDKVEKYSKNPQVQFFYAGVFYEFAIRSWFESRNMWPLSPARAIKYFKENELTFFSLLDSFSSSSPEDRVTFKGDILESVHKPE